MKVGTINNVARLRNNVVQRVPNVIINPYRYASLYPADAFVMVVRTTASSESFKIPMRSFGGQPNCTIDWGDGTEDTITSSASSDLLHTYDDADDYTIVITGTVKSICMNDHSASQPKVRSVEQWGDVGFTYLYAMFYGCTNLVINATDELDFSGVTAANFAFYGATLADPDTSSWHGTVCTTLYQAFAYSGFTTGDVSDLITSACTTVYRMFYGASLANPDVSGADVSNVLTMYHMFNGSVADPDCSSWDIGEVTVMASFCTGGSWSSERYSDALIAFDALSTKQSGVVLGVPGTEYESRAASARQSLIDDYSWSITDAGQA